jgi:hypothetical protein
MANKDQPQAGDTVPKLTLGQRLLTVLPRLGGSSGPVEAPSPPSDHDVIADAGADDVPSRRDRDEVEPAPPRSPVRERQRPTGPGQSGKTKEELALAIKRLDDRERRIGIFMAPLGVALGIFSMVSAINTKTSHVRVKGQLSRETLITLGIASIVLSGLVLVAALSRRRSFLGFALVFLGTSFGFPLLLPFWFVGGWLIFRAYKWQKELAAMGGRPAGRASRAPSTGRAAAGGDDARARGRAAATARAKKKAPEPKGPPPSKRYTPPKPTRPRPPAPPT